MAEKPGAEQASATPRPEKRVFGQGERADRTGAVALFGDVAKATGTPGGRAEMADRLAPEADASPCGERHLAGDRCQELTLAIAGNPGDAEDFAGSDGEGNVAQGDVVVGCRPEGSGNR